MFAARYMVSITFCVALLPGCATYKEPVSGEVAYLVVPDEDTIYKISNVQNIKWEQIAGGVTGGYSGYPFLIKKMDVSSYKTFSASYYNQGMVITTTCRPELPYGIKPEPNGIYSINIKTTSRGCNLALEKLDISLDELKKNQKEDIYPEGTSVLKTNALLIKRQF